MNGKIALLIVLYQGCGPFKLPMTNVDVTLRPHVEQFRDLCEQYEVTCNFVGLKMELVDPMPDLEPGDGFKTAGFCTESDDGTAYIAISKYDPGTFRQWTPYLFQALIFHELAHCTMGKDHDKKGSKTLMAPALLEEDYLKFHWNKLVTDLFTRRNPL